MMPRMPPGGVELVPRPNLAADETVDDVRVLDEEKWVAFSMNFIVNVR